MLIRDVLKLSAINAFRGRTRTILTILSVTIGIASVLLVSSIGTSGEAVIIREIEKLGLEGVSVYKNEMGSGTILTAADVEKLKSRFKEIEAAIPIVVEIGSFKMNRTEGSSVLLGVGGAADSVYDVKILHGKIPKESDVISKKRIAVIDDELAMKTYKRTNVVGKKILIGINGKNEEFEVFGVIRSQKDGINKFFGNNIPDFVYLPYTVLNEMRNKNEITQISIKSSNKGTDGSNFADYLNKIKGEEAYLSENVSTKMEEIKSITGLISLLITTIAAIALCVAGIGIMNSMFSSCTERRREIGVCMAIGAGFGDILMCFLFEAIIISILGGFAGAAIGILGGSAVSKILNLQYEFNLITLVVAEIISVLFGIVFSIMPAIKAARLDPIKALRRN